MTGFGFNMEFTTSAKYRLMAALVRLAGLTFSVREASAESGVPVKEVRRLMAGFETAGVVRSVRETGEPITFVVDVHNPILKTFALRAALEEMELLLREPDIPLKEAAPPPKRSHHRKSPPR